MTNERLKQNVAETKTYGNHFFETLELYFTETTALTKNGETVAFDQLAEGQKVEVEVKADGKRLDPISVKILE